MKKLTILVYLTLCLSIGTRAQMNMGEMRASIFKISEKSNYLLVKYNNSEGFVLIDMTSKQIIKWPEREKHRFFEQNGIAISSDLYNNYEYLDIKNKLQNIGDTYRWVTFFNNGRAIVAAPGDYLKIINEQGTTVSYLKEFNGRKIENARNFSGGLAAVQTEGGLWGFVDISGQIVIQPQFSDVSYFNEGYCVVETQIAENSMLAGVIDNKGNYVLPLSDKYCLSEKVVNGLLAYRVDSYMGILDMKGTEIIRANPDFTEIGPFTKNGMAIFSNGRALGLIDKKGEIILRAKYQNIQIAEDKIIVSDFMYQKSFVFNTKMKQVKELPYIVVIKLPNENYLAANVGGMIMLDKEFNEIGTRTIIDSKPNFGENKYTLARSDYYDTEGLAAKIMTDITIDSFKKLDAKSGVVDMIKIFHLAPTDTLRKLYFEPLAEFNEYDGDYHEYERTSRNSFNYRFFGPNIQSDHPGTDLRSRERMIQDSIEAAMRTADSLAAMEASMIDGGMSDSLYFISNDDEQEISEGINNECGVTYKLKFNDKIKNRIYKERKNTCELCEVKRVEVNSLARLQSWSIEVKLYNKAYGKAELIFEDMKAELARMGFTLVKEMKEHENKFLIKDAGGKAKGSIQLQSTSGILLQMELS